MWARLYANHSVQGLPWATSDPFPLVRRAVETGWFKPPGPILDVGCGLGSNVLWLATHGFRATGIDVAPGAIAAADARRTGGAKRADFRVDDMLASSLPDRHYRGAVDIGCFQTLPPHRRRDYATGLARVLRPGATFLVTWVAREETGAWGPPHRLSVLDVVVPFEPLFVIGGVEYRERTTPLSARPRASARPLATLSGYTARLIRRSEPQPPPR
jgi:SAM-dependent methyltransferase